ncbi:glycosyltransferase [Pedobacter sp. HMF7647]|uniref:Glycosyltransferase n=1 Tax=Hufsiella arboris TaxID=2695275 RepID=A0A7K1Y604_9SPHI|nr:glycosyltransferase family 2 protein [Hufsiella arboris]MXV50014.1 glycosyltransferase [Hufsiella arboris]
MMQKHIPGKETANGQPLVSIIIATFNAEEHLENCLSSISEQKEKNIQLIIVDGGSSDQTLDIIKKWESTISAWTSERDNGIYDALNKGVALATGRWVYFLGSDDYLLPGFSDLTSLLNDEQTVYYGNSEPADLLSGAFSAYRLAKYSMNHQSIIYPAAVFKKYHYELKYPVFADHVLNIKVWGDRQFKKQFYPITIAHYNMHGFSSMTEDPVFKKDKAALIRRHFGLSIYLRFIFKRFRKQKEKNSKFY